MTFIWSVYGEELKKERKYKLIQWLVGSKKVNRKVIWREKIKDFFPEYEIMHSKIGNYLEETFYLKNHPSVAFISTRGTSIQIYFHEDFLVDINKFIETMFPDEIVGISFSGCVVAKMNNEIVSIKQEDKELFKNGLDKMKNKLIAI